MRIMFRNANCCHVSSPEGLQEHQRWSCSLRWPRSFSSVRICLYNIFGSHLRLTTTGIFHSCAGILHPFVGSDAMVFGTHRNISNASNFSRHGYTLSVTAIPWNESSISNHSEGLIQSSLIQHCCDSLFGMHPPPDMRMTSTYR